MDQTDKRSPIALARLLLIAGILAAIWILLSLFSSSSASADEAAPAPSLLGTLTSAVGSTVGNTVGSVVGNTSGQPAASTAPTPAAVSPAPVISPSATPAAAAPALPVLGQITAAVAPVVKPVLSSVAPVLSVVSPVVGTVSPVVEIVNPVIAPVTPAVVRGVDSIVASVPLLEGLLGTAPVAGLTQTATGALSPITGALDIPVGTAVGGILGGGFAASTGLGLSLFSDNSSSAASFSATSLSATSLSATSAKGCAATNAVASTHRSALRSSGSTLAANIAAITDSRNPMPTGGTPSNDPLHGLPGVPTGVSVNGSTAGGFNRGSDAVATIGDRGFFATLAVAIAKRDSTAVLPSAPTFGCDSAPD